MSKMAYSYHTFLFPFLWNDNGNVKWDDFKKVLSIGKRWIEIKWGDELLSSGKSRESCLQDYQAYQYFTEAANSAIFNSRGDNIVRCFVHKIDGNSLNEKGKYIIHKKTDAYTLDINEIRLHIYDTGVAIIILELENNDNTHFSIDAVNSINEYGRRINMPFFTPGQSHPLCADKISITYNNNLFSEESYLATLKSLDIDFHKVFNHSSLSYIMSPIRKIIDGDGEDNGGYKVTSYKTHRKYNCFYIKPCVDDRMFVCCLVRDETASKQIQAYNSDKGEYAVLSDCELRDDNGDVINDTISNSIYKLCYIETNLTCQNTIMKKNILLRSLYNRWIDYGTIYAVTHHSFVCLTGESEDIQTSVIFPFLTIYVQLMIFALAQRATILTLSSEASTVSEGFNNENEISIEQIKTIEKLQAKYVKAQNQILLFEVTVQEQGVEIYDLIQKQLYINKNKNELIKQMANLRDIANISNDRLERLSDELRNENEKRINTFINVLTVFGIPFAIIQTFSIWFKANYLINCYIQLVITILSCIIGIALSCYLNRLHKTKKGNNRC